MMQKVESICMNCAFYHEHSRKDRRGECRRDPPVVAKVLDDCDVLSYWPGVDASEWCGKFDGGDGV